MTEDDAFLRTIVDNPGHDLPRLVYADFLDDRDDPRGSFLRAEVEWAQPWKEGKRPGDATELRAMAADLDPLWVARVSRPPVGVCCPRLALSTSGTPASFSELGTVADSLGIPLAPELSALLMNYNLGDLRGGELIFPALDEFGDMPISGIVCLDDPHFVQDEKNHEVVLRTQCERREIGLKAQFIYLAATLDDRVFFVASCRPSEHDAVRFVDVDEGTSRLVAPSIGEFLAKLQPLPRRMRS